jgi:hypothetical protein
MGRQTHGHGIIRPSVLGSMPQVFCSTHIVRRLWNLCREGLERWKPSDQSLTLTVGPMPCVRRSMCQHHIQTPDCTRTEAPLDWAKMGWHPAHLLPSLLGRHMTRVRWVNALAQPSVRRPRTCLPHCAAAVGHRTQERWANAPERPQFDASFSSPNTSFHFTLAHVI